VTLREVVDALDLEVLHEGLGLGAPVRGGYSGDLLSNVLATAKPGDLWITIQHHINIVGVAQVAELAGVLIAGGGALSDAVLAKAREAGVPILRSEASSFEIAGRLFVCLGSKPC
jgi:predicted transcriptional regulator